MKPFDRVLVRVTPDWEWMPHIFSKEVGDVYFTIDDRCWQYCVPFEGNEHLLGTTITEQTQTKHEFSFGEHVEAATEPRDKSGQLRWRQALYMRRCDSTEGGQYVVLFHERNYGSVVDYVRKADW